METDHDVYRFQLKLQTDSYWHISMLCAIVIHTTHAAISRYLARSDVSFSSRPIDV